MYTVTFSKQAIKALRKMPRNVARLISDKVDQLATDPDSLANQAKKLTDDPGYRLRIGDWRVVYTVYDDTVTIHVIRIAPRGGVYQ